MAINKYQTLSSFILSPFHKKNNLQKDTTYDAKYRDFVSKNKISVHAMCIIEDSYYYHIKIPSESQKDKEVYYDVVIRFFTDNKEVQMQTHLNNYYIQFFSNCPSFMYQYAYLYNKEKYLIEALYKKLDADYIDVPPAKTNANMDISYDKSIYFACRFLNESKFRLLEKGGPIEGKKKTKEKFMADISDFRSMKYDQTIVNEERKLSKSLSSMKLKSQSSGISLKGKKTATKSTSNLSSFHVVNKKTGNNKKVARKTTRRT